MTIHNERNKDKLIGEIKLQYGKTPVTIWWDRNKRRYSTQEALSPKNTDMAYNRRFDLVGTFNIDTEPEDIKKMLLKVERMNGYDQPIQTSMQHLPIDREE